METNTETMQAPEEKPVLITKKELQEAIKMRGPVGSVVASTAMRMMGLNKANWHYGRCAGGNANDFAARAMKEVEVGYDIKPEQLEYVPRKGAFILLANHHYGGLDGMMTLDLIGHIRPDYHTVSTFLLGKVPEMKPAMLMAPSLIKSGVSEYVVIFTWILMLVCIVATILTNRHIPSRDKDLVTAAEELTRFKKIHAEWIKFAIPMLIIWVGFLVWDVLRNWEFDRIAAIFFLAGVGAGIILGGVVGLKMRRDQLNAADELLEQIEELRRDA